MIPKPAQRSMPSGAESTIELTRDGVGIRSIRPYHTDRPIDVGVIGRIRRQVRDESAIPLPEPDPV